MTGSVIAGDVVTGPALHLIDIENLCGGWISSNRCAEVWDHYLHQVGVSPEDQIIVAASTHHAAPAFFTLPPTARRLLVSNAPDAADRALLEAVQLDRVTSRHCSVVIASGDGAFAPLAQLLRATGLRVTQVVTDKVSVSGELYRSCEDLIRLPALRCSNGTSSSLPRGAHQPTSNSASRSSWRSLQGCARSRPHAKQEHRQLQVCPQHAEHEQRSETTNTRPRNCGKMPVSSFSRASGRR